MSDLSKSVIRWSVVTKSVVDGHIQWRTLFDERQLKEVDFSRLYADQFAHGTDGHNAKLIIARLSEVLDSICASIKILPDDEQS